MIQFSDGAETKKLKAKYNNAIIEKRYLKEHLVNLSSEACLDNMIKNRASARMDYIKFDNTHRVRYNTRNILLKRQIQSHKVKSSNSILQKSKSNLFQTKIPQLKESKHRKNVSAIWKSKKPNVEVKAKSSYQPTVSFYVNKGQQPVQYQLKIGIKKVQSKSSQKQHQTTLNLQKQQQELIKGFESQSEKERVVDTEIGQDEVKNQKQQMKQLAESEQISIKKPIPRHRYSYLRERFSKITTTSKKTKKTKEEMQRSELENRKLYHIRNILQNPSNCDEQYIEIVAPQMIKIHRKQVIKAQEVKKKTALSFTVSHYNSQNTTLTHMYEKNPNKKVEIASITKIMTCFLIINICKVFKIQINTQKVLVSERASKMPGTSAELSYSDILTIYQLLHGLMLPSGNDAAVALAQWGGKAIRKYCDLASKHLNLKNNNMKSLNFCNEYAIQKKSHQKLFITHMNKVAKALNLHNTYFANTHGLMNEKSYSTSNDVAILTSIAMKNETFRDIVGKKEFSCRIFNRTYSQQRPMLWVNTNKLLNIQGFIGVKTGVTPTAGPCLSSMFKINQKQYIIIIVLKVKSLESRFKQSLQLLKEVMKFIQKINTPQIIKNINMPNKVNYNDHTEDVNTMEDKKQINSEPEPDEDQYFQ